MPEETIGPVTKGPQSGLWYGTSVAVTLSRQGSCGERVKGRSGKAEPFWAVLFFDEDTVSGHAIQADRPFRLQGWWGAAKHLLPLVSDLAETELWETGEEGLSFTLWDGRAEETCFAWLKGSTIAGYRRKQGG